MKPFSRRNRVMGVKKGRALTSPCPSQLPEIECAQKDLNLQPAGSDALSNSRETASVPYSAGLSPAAEPPTKPEASSGYRSQSVTEPITFLASGHKAAEPLKLAHRPDILGFLEGVTLAAAMGAVKVWR